MLRPRLSPSLRSGRLGPRSVAPGPDTTRRARRRDDRGATMVEFVLIAPLLFVLLFGIIDFGWMLNQQQDVRYGAREGARTAAVAGVHSSTPTAQDVVDAVCERMDSSESAMRVSLVATPSSGGTAQIGDLAQIEVWKPARDITGFFTDVIGDSVIKSSLTFRLEQPPAWSNTTTLSESSGVISGGLNCSVP